MIIATSEAKLYQIRHIVYISDPRLCTVDDMDLLDRLKEIKKK